MGENREDTELEETAESIEDDQDAIPPHIIYSDACEDNIYEGTDGLWHIRDAQDSPAASALNGEYDRLQFPEESKEIIDAISENSRNPHNTGVDIYSTKHSTFVLTAFEFHEHDKHQKFLTLWAGDLYDGEHIGWHKLYTSQSAMTPDNGKISDEDNFNLWRSAYSSMRKYFEGIVSKPPKVCRETQERREYLREKNIARMTLSNEEFKKRYPAKEKKEGDIDLAEIFDDEMPM